MTANEQHEFQKKYLLVLDQNALKCMRNLGLLEAMHTEYQKLDISGPHPSADLFNHLATNAQDQAMLALSRLFGTQGDEVTVRRLASNQAFKNPENHRDLKKAIPNEVLENLKGWRDSLLAHSLDEQLVQNIPSKFPITPSEMADALSVAISTIHAYANEVGLTGHLRTPADFDPRAQHIDPSISLMVRGLFSTRV